MFHILRALLGDSTTRKPDEGTWLGASLIEDRIFGRIFQFLWGVVGFFGLMGCAFIGLARYKDPLVMIVCGVLWAIPFIFAAIFLSSLRFALFSFVGKAINRVFGNFR